jgi:hypothetical protein
MFKVTLERRYPPCFITLRAQSFVICEVEPLVVGVFDGLDVDLVISKDSHGRVMIEIGPNWKININQECSEECVL